MKVQFVIPMTLLVSFALVGVMRMRRKDQEKDDKRVRFQDIKLKVTNDVLVDYQKERTEKQHMMEKLEGELKTLEEQMVALQTKLDSSKGSANECQGNQKSSQDQLALTETDLNKLKAEIEKETGVWKSEIAAIQQQLAAESAVCKHLKAAPEAARNMCHFKEGVEAKQQNQEAPKKDEAPKEEAPKQEAPKQEDAPKQEAPKQEDAPKQEAPKQEVAPKQEAKAEVPAPKKEAQR